MISLLYPLLRSENDSWGEVSGQVGEVTRNNAYSRTRNVVRDHTWVQLVVPILNQVGEDLQ